METNKTNSKEKTRPGSLMTNQTYLYLLSELDRVKMKLEVAFIESGEAAGSSGDWHDNAAYDSAIQKINIISIEESRLRGVLDKVTLIDRPLEFGSVKIGCKVKVLFKDESNPEIFNILGPEDANYYKGNVISFESPLAKGVLNRTVGEVFTYKVGNTQFTLTILEIGVADQLIELKTL